MKLLVTTDAHIYKAPDGSYWCNAIYGYSFWQRYMNIFDKIRVAARVKAVNKIESNWIKVDGDNLEIYEVPFFQGIVQLIREYFKINKILGNIYDSCDAAVFRLPSPIGFLILGKKPKQLPFSLEVVYDLNDDLNNKNHSLFMHVIYQIQAILLKKACLKANGVSYVTKYAIQKNFPSKSIIKGKSDDRYFDSNYSTIVLNKNSFGTTKDYTKKVSFRFVLSDISMNTDRKGEKIVIDVLAMLRDRGFNVYATFIGDGSKRKEFENYAKAKKVEEFVHFTGILSTPEEVRYYLDSSDFYFFPSQAEGLPRGLIEAMAMGLVCISSNVGGIPEILDEQFLAGPTDSIAYCKIITNLLGDLQRLNSISENNIKIARTFDNSILQKRRDNFYYKLYKIANEERK